MFDANQLDLWLIWLACEAGLPVTLIGDPWQALYGFRGARPELVPQLLERFSFEALPMTRSFRFVTDQTRSLAVQLRQGLPARIPVDAPENSRDVVLASQWSTLWEGPDTVLPLSFGRIDNMTDAAIVLLVDRLVGSHFGQSAIFLPEALSMLGLDKERLRTDGASALDPAIMALQDDRPVDALRLLRAAVTGLGCVRRLRRLPAASEDGQIERLSALRRRLRKSQLVPGLTVHQAKGREWDSVGVILTDAESSRLGAGLSQGNDADRRLYVAFTRARKAVAQVGRTAKS